MASQEDVIVTRYQLIELLFKGGQATFIQDDTLYRLLGIDREDGSGRCFNLTVVNTGTNLVEHLFIRTSD